MFSSSFRSYGLAHGRVRETPHVKLPFRRLIGTDPGLPFNCLCLFRGQGDSWFETFVCGAVFEQLAVAHDLSGKSEFCLSGEVRANSLGKASLCSR